MRNSQAPYRRASGFSLVEAVATILVLGIALTAVVQTLSFAFRKQSDGLWQSRTVALAEAYFEEMAAKRFDEASGVGGIPACAPTAIPCSALGPDAGETRTDFDDVDDFDGLDESPPVDATGTTRTGYDGFRVQISVAYLDAAQVGTLGLDDVTDAKRVDITVTPPGGGSALTFRSVRANF